MGCGPGVVLPRCDVSIAGTFEEVEMVSNTGPPSTIRTKYIGPLVRVGAIPITAAGLWGGGPLGGVGVLVVWFTFATWIDRAAWAARFEQAALVAVSTRVNAALGVVSTTATVMADRYLPVVEAGDDSIDRVGGAIGRVFEVVGSRWTSDEWEFYMENNRRLKQQGKPKYVRWLRLGVSLASIVKGWFL